MNQAKKEKKNKQAFIIIHGIGDQRPMSTICSFIKAVLSNHSSNDDEKISYWNKPDHFS